MKIYCISSIITVATAFAPTSFRATAPHVTTTSDASCGALLGCVNRRTSALHMAEDDTSVVESSSYELLGRPARPGRPLKVAIAGGGVGGLTTALCMLKKGFDVTVYEKTAAFARFGGPIQFASNALSVIKEIDEELFERVMDKFTFTGTRTCGIKDGLSLESKRYSGILESKQIDSGFEME